MKKIVIWMLVLSMLATMGLGIAFAEEELSGHLVVLGCDSDQNELGEQWERFREAYPGITLDYSNLTSEKYTELVTAMKSAGEQIDVMFMNAQDLRRYATAGDLLDLSDLSYKDRFRPVGIETFTINGKLWAVPRGSIGGFNVYYNKALLEKYGFEYPETYDELVTIGQALAADGIATVTHPGKNIYLWPVWFFSTYEQTTGGESLQYTIDTLVGRRKFTDPEVVEALDLIGQFNKDGLFIKGVNSTDGDGSLANIITARALMAITLDWRAVKKATEGSGEVELDVALLPYLTEDKVQPIYPGGPGTACSIYSGISEENLPLAHAFIEFITRDDQIAMSAAKWDWATTINANVPSPSEEPMIQKFDKEIAEHMVTYLDWYWPPEITRAFQEGIQAVADGQKDGATAAEEIQAVFDKLVAEGYTFVE